MKMFITFMLLFVLVPQFAFASRPEQLKLLIDEFKYSMEVEWDQKDEIFAKTHRKEFLAKMNDLVLQGLTQEEIIQASGFQIDKISLEIESQNLSKAEDIADFLLHHREMNRGANWIGDVVLATVFFTPILVMIGFMIHGSLTREDRLNRINSCLDANPVNQDHCFDLI